MITKCLKYSYFDVVLHRQSYRRTDTTEEAVQIDSFLPHGGGLQNVTVSFKG